MASHSGRSFLNSCLKVPIDPCNNCPAPNYNRPKMHLGILPSMTPTTVMTTKTYETDLEPKWTCSGIRSLTKFYDSIPDYGELHHLTEEEFYSTLDTLRSTCRELKINSIVTPAMGDPCSITSSSLSSTNCYFGDNQSKKSKKNKKKVSGKDRKNSESQESEFSNVETNIKSGHNVDNPFGSSTAKSCKSDLDEIDNLKKTLTDFEAEFQRPATSSILNKTELRRKEKFEDVDTNATEKVPVRSTITSSLRERLRKSLSFNDLNSISDPIELADLRNKIKTLEKLSYKGEKNAYQNQNKMSNYFQEIPKTVKPGYIPKIAVDTQTTEASTERTQRGKKSKQISKDANYKIPFKIFDLDSSKRENSTIDTTPSPVHPVARPNLAATLRAEVSRKKVRELKNNCTYHDTTPQFDWEVRKTPAWKTLSLNETHKEILSIRLATRKAEQDLQKREYELNMELMRQRVKSAPLLLEGQTFWGPNVGKLTHNCQREGRRHMCQSSQQRLKRNKKSSRSHSCRRSLFHHSDIGLNERHIEKQTTPSVSKSQESSRSQKLNTLRKIYGASPNSNRKNQSPCSNHSANIHISSKRVGKKTTMRSNPNLVVLEDDSGDELSSLDRAFL